MESIDFGNIPEIDGSKFQAYIDFNNELQNKFIQMKNHIDHLTKQLDDLKLFTIGTINWTFYWKSKYESLTS